MGSNSGSPQPTELGQGSTSSNSFELQDIVGAADGPDTAYDAGDDILLTNHRQASMDSIQSYELYTPDEDTRVLRKLDRRLVSFMALLYCLSFLDRSNIGNARIAGLSDDLQLSSTQYEWLLWAFYITYIAFEWMTLMYRLIPPRIYIPICILSWGILASLQAVATSFSFLVILRALLGVGEAAFGPGVPFYLSFFFKRNELAFRSAMFISASPLSASFAGALAYLITKASEQGRLSPWRLLFLLEGFPSVLVAVWAWDFIPDSPETTRWLTPREREVAVQRLRSERENEAKIKESNEDHRDGEGRINLNEVLQTLKDIKCYLTAMMFFCCNVAFSSMPVFSPTIISDMGYRAIEAQALSAPPYLFAFVVVLLTAYWSDRLQSRSTFIILHSLLASIGYGTIAVCGYYRFESPVLRYFALFPATAGFFSAITIIITWTINNQETDSMKGTGMAIINVIGQCGPILGTSIFPEKDAPFYMRGMSICAISMFAVGVFAGMTRWLLIKKNRQAEQAFGHYTSLPLEGDENFRARNNTFLYML